MVDTDTRGRRTLAVVGQDADATFYAERCVAAGDRVLVLGAADGRIAAELAQRQLSVVAIEPSALMAELAESRRAAQPPEVQGRLRLMHADLRAVRISEHFPAVIAPQNALGMLDSVEALDAALATVANHLAPGGVFIFDLAAGERDHFSRMRDEGHPHGPGASGDAARRLFLPHLREHRRTPERTTPPALRRLRVRLFTPAEIDAALVRIGLVALERYGSFDESPFSPGDPHQVVVAGTV